MKASDFKLAEIKPLPGVTPETVWAHMKRHARKDYRCQDEGCYACARYPKGGSTARWITASENHPGCVICPTCKYPVELKEWWSHGCKSITRAGAC
jgi:hypothetical protein